jgi:hypothetical protein
VIYVGNDIYEFLFGRPLWVEVFWEKWFNRYGRALIEIYDEKKGGNYYLSKYITKELCDWDIENPKRKEVI